MDNVCNRRLFSIPSKVEMAQYTYYVSSQIIFSSTKGGKRQEKFMFIVAIVICRLRTSHSLCLWDCHDSYTAGSYSLS